MGYSYLMKCPFWPFLEHNPPLTAHGLPFAVNNVAKFGSGRSIWPDMGKLRGGGDASLIHKA